jgi:hypothetical protein
MKVFVIALIIGIFGGGVLEYLYGAYVYNKAENVIKRAQKLPADTKAKLKEML